jgi:Tyrosine phosphatase family
MQGACAGEYSDQPLVQRLIDADVKTFVNLTRPDEKLFFDIGSYRRHLPNGVNYYKHSLYAFGLAPVQDLMGIVKIIEDGKPSCLHCRQGLDRTGTVAVLTLMNRGLILRDALSEIRDRREGLEKASPGKRYHFRYLLKAGRQLTGSNSLDECEAIEIVLGAHVAARIISGQREVEVYDMDNLDAAVGKETEKIIVNG